MRDPMRTVLVGAVVAALLSSCADEHPRAAAPPADAAILIANERTPKPELTLVVTIDGWFRDIEAHPIESEAGIARKMDVLHDNDPAGTDVIALHLETRTTRRDGSGVRAHDLALAVRRIQAAATATDAAWARRLVFVLDERFAP
jgi:hypothetical protein